MIFDELGLPKDSGASDYQDSARLAGIMATFGHSQAPDLSKYIVSGKYRRHPVEYKYSMSRDQTVCLFSGLKAQGKVNLVDPAYNTEGDLVSPSVRNHFKRCANFATSRFGDMWLKADVLWSAFVKPMGEPNQLLCVLWNADVKYLKLWTKLNKKWKAAIEDYWCGWRGEPELAALMISKIEGRING